MSVTVIGGGTMGASIAATFLLHGHPVTVVEVDAERAATVRSAVRKELGHQRDPDNTPRFVATPNWEGVKPADLVVETVTESVAIKQEVLGRAEDIVAEGGLLCSNTSSLSITTLAQALQRPGRFLGMHFFQPVPKTQLVELVTSPETAAGALADARWWVEKALGREAIVVTDSAGFATSRLGLAIGLEAMRMVEEGIASPEDIDKGMMLGYQHAVGPLRMSDMVGLDVRLAIAEHLAQELGPRFSPPELLRSMVAEGRLGQKTGQGFFAW